MRAFHLTLAICGYVTPHVSVGQDYYFAIEAFDEVGVSRVSATVHMRRP